MSEVPSISVLTDQVTTSYIFSHWPLPLHHLQLAPQPAPMWLLNPSLWQTTLNNDFIQLNLLSFFNPYYSCSPRAISLALKHLCHNVIMHLFVTILLILAPQLVCGSNEVRNCAYFCSLLHFQVLARCSQGMASPWNSRKRARQCAQSRPGHVQHWLKHQQKAWTSLKVPESTLQC